MPEIAAINGIPVQEIINSLKALVKADGANDAKRVADLNLFGIGPYESFDVYFPLLFPPVNGQYMLEIMPAGGQGRQEVPVRPITRNERTLRMQKSASASVQPDYKLWELTFWEDGTAYLRLSTFDAFILDFEWKDFLDNAFAEIKKRKSQNLVLDIRWNEGGQDEILLYLGRMLAKAPISPTPRKDYVAYERVPDDLRPYLFTWMEDVYDFKGKIEKKDDNGLFLLKKGRDFNIKPASNAFKGNIYLLVNAANSSATFYFAEISKETGMARILGETTGGSQQGLNGGVMFFVRLPNSKIEFDIPIIGSYSLERPAGGISPDIYVQETVETIRSGQDPALEAVRRLLKQ
jgi:C-terminal processing protease CtpA/Prc